MSGQGKGMSSRLLTMKVLHLSPLNLKPPRKQINTDRARPCVQFMQRAAINNAKTEDSGEKKSPTQDNAAPSKRQRTSRETYSVANNSSANFPSPYTPHPSTPQTAGSNVSFSAGAPSSSSELATIAEALKAEEDKRAAAVAKQAADAGQEQWVIDYGNASVPEPKSTLGSEPTYILPDSMIAGQEDDDEDDEDEDSDTESHAGGRMRFGGFGSRKSRQVGGICSDLSSMFLMAACLCATDLEHLLNILQVSDSSKQEGADTGEQADDLIDQYSGLPKQQRTNRHGEYKEPSLKNLTSLSGKGGVSGGGGSAGTGGGNRKEYSKGSAKGTSKSKGRRNS